MNKVRIEDVRNVAFVGHGSAGKTSLIDRMLFKSGAAAAPSSVDAGTSVCDFDPEEKRHKFTIEAKVAHFQHAGRRFNVIDTPGYPDFIGQTIGALRAADVAVIVINAHTGIAANTRRVFQEAERAGLGRVIVINKMDDENADYGALVRSIQELWGPSCVPVNVPIGQGRDFRAVIDTLDEHDDVRDALIDPNDIHHNLIDSIVQTDDEVLERFLNGDLPTHAELDRLTVQAVVHRTLTPILACSAKNDVGVKELFDFLAADGPSPAHVERKARKDGVESVVAPTADGPLVAQVFHTRIDPFVQKLSFLRLYSGRLRRDDQVHVSTARKLIKIGPLLEVQGAETHATDEATAGDVVAVAKIDELHTGATLGDFELPPLSFPAPMVGLAVAPKSRHDEAKLSIALHKVVEEDSTFRVDHDPQTHELVVYGMSELHLAIVRERLQRREKLEIETKPPKIPFRETIQQPAEGMYRHKKQSGGRGQFAEVHIRLFPLPPGVDLDDFCSKERFPHLKERHYDPARNFLWVNSIVGGTIPGNFLPAVEKGFLERMSRGVLAGHQVQDVAVDVHFGKHHDVDSSEAAFKTAASICFRNVFLAAKPTLLEPIVKLFVTVPEAYVGDVYGDLSSRGGRVHGADSAGGGDQTVVGECPLREMATYARTLSSMTAGQGSFMTEFSRYEPAPPTVQQEIVAKAAPGVEEDE